MTAIHVKIFLSFVMSPPLSHFFTAVSFKPVNYRHTFFVAWIATFLVSSTFLNKEGSLRLFFCLLFQHQVAGFWHEHLLNVFQNSEKIEADATFFTHSWISRFHSSNSVAVRNLLWCVRSLLGSFGVFCSGFFVFFFILPSTLHYFFSHTLCEQIYLY